ncbi:MAG: CMP-binding protein [Gammaproteobacteria bacterium HGW-Gammaproteobacteria-2]|nr:MAG: CMP-binding protein [Gammaproteobacteria bacterium HGW-Gammaproteobacteria-2]
MQTVLVASSKGGAGKTTLATHLAAQFALDGKRTVLVDADPQGSSTRWCQRRAALDSAVLPIDGGAFLEHADAVLVPIIPSLIDLEATVPFLNSLAQQVRVKKGKLPVALVGNRLKPWTSASQQAVEQLNAWPYPLVAQLRDSQAYVLLIGLGKSLFDYHSEQILRHQADWAPLLRWLKKTA